VEVTEGGVLSWDFFTDTHDIRFGVAVSFTFFFCVNSLLDIKFWVFCVRDCVLVCTRAREKDKHDIKEVLSVRSFYNTTNYILATTP
jgi:hypothetical protein